MVTSYVAIPCGAEGDVLAWDDLLLLIFEQHRLRSRSCKREQRPIVRRS
jgi:hypothetical protein